ncbi:MAG: nucleotide excision repair endonuclease [bacterium]
MKDKLYNYLKARGGCASSVEIVGQLLNMRGARRHVAEKIVAGMAKNQPVFVSDGLGNWYIQPQPEGAETPLSSVIFNVLELRGDAGRLAQSRYLQLGVHRVQDGRVMETILNTAIRGEPGGQTALPVRDAVAKPWREVLPNLLSVLEEGVLTAFSPVAVRNFLISEALNLCGVFLALEALSLKKLLRRLRPENKVQTAAEAAAVLQLPFLESEELPDLLSNQTNLFFAVLEKCREKGLDSLEKVLEFQRPQSLQVNLEDKQISRRFLENLPESPGVYLMKDHQDKVFYVGKAKNLKQRVGSYFRAREQVDRKMQAIWQRIFDIEIIEMGSELEAFLEEQKLIKKNQPEINLKIEVHAKSRSEWHPKDLIMVLPARIPSRLTLFCVSSEGKCERIQIHRQKDLSRSAQEKLRRLFYPAKKRPPDELQREQAELFWRWFAQHRDRVSWIDVKELADFDACLRLLERYQQGEIAGQGRIIYRMNGSGN